jgi:hypothetical protein
MATRILTNAKIVTVDDRLSVHQAAAISRSACRSSAMASPSCPPSMTTARDF